MITPQNFEADINNLDTLGIMIRLKPTETFEGGTALLAPNTYGPAMHTHPNQSELFSVVQGELEVFRGDKWIVVRQGERLLVPKNTPHTFRNLSAAPVVVDFALTPKLGLTFLLLTIDELVRSGKIARASSLKSKLYLSQVVSAFPQVNQPVKPPKAVIWLMAKIGKLIGLSIEKEKYRAEFLRPLRLWDGKKRPASGISEQLEEMLF